MPQHAVLVQLSTVMYVEAPSPAAALAEVRSQSGAEFELSAVTGFGATLKAASLADRNHLFPVVVEIDGDDATELHLRWTRRRGHAGIEGEFRLPSGRLVATLRNHTALRTGHGWSMTTAEGEVLASGVREPEALEALRKATSLGRSMTCY